MKYLLSRNVNENEMKMKTIEIKCLLSRKISLKSSSLPAFTSKPMLDISLITISTLKQLRSILFKKNAHREILKLRRWLDNPRECAVPKLRCEVEADIFRLSIEI